MAARTIDNCSIIKKAVKLGIGEPIQYRHINKCYGYQKSEDNDESIDICKRCKFCIFNNDIDI